MSAAEEEALAVADDSEVVLDEGETGSGDISNTVAEVAASLV